MVPNDSIHQHVSTTPVHKLVSSPFFPHMYFKNTSKHNFLTLSLSSFLPLFILPHSDLLPNLLHLPLLLTNREVNQIFLLEQKRLTKSKKIYLGELLEKQNKKEEVIIVWQSLLLLQFVFPPSFSPLLLFSPPLSLTLPLLSLLTLSSRLLSIKLATPPPVFPTQFPLPPPPLPPSALSPFPVFLPPLLLFFFLF